jgi:hypothetical protein
MEKNMKLLLSACLVGFKICQVKDLACHDFSCHLVCCQNLSTSHIWLAKCMSIFLSNFSLPNLWHGKIWPQTKQALIFFKKCYLYAGVLLGVIWILSISTTTSNKVIGT